MELRFFPINVFKETPQVTFFDAGIGNSNGSDVMIHSGQAIPPPDNLKNEQYHVHNHQKSQNKSSFFLSLYKKRKPFLME